MSTLKRPGPIRLLFAKIAERCPAPGALNAAGFSHRYPCFTYTSSDTWSGRWFAWPFSALSTPVVAEKCAAASRADDRRQLPVARERPNDAGRCARHLIDRRQVHDVLLIRRAAAAAVERRVTRLGELDPRDRRLVVDDVGDAVGDRPVPGHEQAVRRAVLRRQQQTLVLRRADRLDGGDRAVELALRPGSRRDVTRRWFVVAVVAPGLKTAGFN